MEYGGGGDYITDEEEDVEEEMEHNAVFQGSMDNESSYIKVKDSISDI